VYAVWPYTENLIERLNEKFAHVLKHTKAKSLTIYSTLMDLLNATADYDRQGQAAYRWYNTVKYRTVVECASGKGHAQ